MPYNVKKSGKEWITYNTETGDIKGHHDSRFKAVAQMRLLYKIENDKKKEQILLVSKEIAGFLRK